MLHRLTRGFTAFHRLSVAIILLFAGSVIALALGYSVVFIIQENAYFAEVVTEEQVPVRELQAAVNRFHWAGGITLFLTGALAYCIIRQNRSRHVQPLREAKEVLNRMSQGDLDQRLPEDWADGIGELAHGFNYMAGRMQTFLQLTSKMAAGASFEEIFDFIYDSFQPFLPYDRIGVALIDVEEKTIRAERACSRFPVKLYNGYTLPLKKTSLPEVIRRGKPRLINDLKEYLDQHPSSESTRLILEEGMRSSITLPLRVDDRPLGALFFSSQEVDAYGWQHVEFLELAAGSIAPVLEKGILIGDLILSATLGFAKLVTFRDYETGEHLRRIRRYASTLAKTMATRSPYDQKIDEVFVRDIYTFSPLHDIGKVGIPDSILLKPGKLTQEEFEIMKGHTLIGAQALSEAEKEARRLSYPLFQQAIDIAAYHHERYDGTGYPAGLAGTKIPLCARIVAVADVFDALTSSRPYKPAYSFDESVEVVVAARGTHFEPGIIECFLSCVEEFRVIYEAFREPVPSLGD